MKIMPMGDYYVWHCDWCDSTNYTLWARMDRDGVACSACHHTFSLLTEASPAGNRPRTTEKQLPVCPC